MSSLSNKCVCFQVVISYLSFLCARLLDLHNETRAARVIQAAWRKYRLEKDWQLHKVGPTKNGDFVLNMPKKKSNGEAKSRVNDD